MADRDRAPGIPEPSGPALSFRGDPITPHLILKLWRSGMRQKQESRKRILKVRALRRKEESSLVQLSPSWVRRNPELATWVRSVLHERVTIERDLIARAGAVEPVFDCKPLGSLKRDRDYAEEKEAYLNEWRQQSVPTQTMVGKNVEDGEFGLVVLPAADDLDGMPDFYQHIEEDAYAALSDEAKRSYRRDDADRHGRYAKVDEQVRKQKNPAYDRGDTQASQEAHDAAVRHYLLDKAPSNVRIIPALDCAPFFVRGKGTRRWELAALIERTLYYAEELLEGEYGWQGMGNRKLIPLAYGANGETTKLTAGEVGLGGQFYLYTAYLLCKDRRNGCTRPVIAYTVGGQGTWDSLSGSPDDPASVGLIDLYAQYAKPDGTCPALDGAPLWSYHGGFHTEDDDPDHYWQPALWPFYELILSLEGNATAVKAATAVNAFTGHVYRPDAQLAGVADEAIIEQDGELRVPRVPRPGEIEAAGGEIVPFAQAQVGADAWRLLQAEQLSLQAATAVDQGPDASGHALVVGETLAKVAKRHVRDGVLEAIVSAGEKQLRILQAIYDCHGIRWPLQTVDERPASQPGEPEPGQDVAEYNPAWIGEGTYRLKAVYPNEENLARIDLEANLKQQGLSTFGKVQAAKGESDAERVWIEVLKDKMREHPLYLERVMLGVAQGTGDKDLVATIKLLQQQQQLTQPTPGVPGGTNGLPTAALKRRGNQLAQPPSGGGRPPIAAAIRGGITAGQMGTAAMQNDAMAQLQVQPGTA